MPIYKVVVKNGDSRYRFNYATGKDEYITNDLVEEFKTLGDALAEFLAWTGDGEEEKVSLIYLPEKKEEKGKKQKKNTKRETFSNYQYLDSLTYK